MSELSLHQAEKIIQAAADFHAMVLSVLSETAEEALSKQARLPLPSEHITSMDREGYRRFLADTCASCLNLLKEGAP